MSITRVAYRWCFTSIYQFALRKMEVVASPVDKIVCARTLGAVHWLIDAYAALCKRNKALTVEEGHRLGLEEVLCLWETTLEARDDLPRAVKRTLARHGRLPECLLDGKECSEDAAPSEPPPPESKERVPSFDIPAFKPEYKIPCLNIYDNHRHPLSPCVYFFDVDFLLYPGGGTIRIWRQGSKVTDCHVLVYACGLTV